MTYEENSEMIPRFLSKETGKRLCHFPKKRLREEQFRERGTQRIKSSVWSPLRLRCLLDSQVRAAVCYQVGTLINDPAAQGKVKTEDLHLGVICI